jgi:aspartyl-tRNA(Asn)/glutamyl-tRNA(Gln) amidotransferase subunit C
LTELNLTITRELFDHLVQLAALELDDAQKDYLLAEMNKQLGAIRELDAIELDDHLTPASHGVPYPAEHKPPLREDIWSPNSTPGAITAQAPQFEDGYLIVPDIPHTTLE